MFRFKLKLYCDNKDVIYRSLSSIYRKTLAGAMRDKQIRIMERFEKDIEKSMNNILIKKDRRRSKNDKNVLKTTQIMLNADETRDISKLFQNEINLSAGSPEQLAIRKDGMPKSFLSTRMRSFNSNYSRAVAEAFVTDSELSEYSELHRINITQVRVSPDFQLLNVYWISLKKDSDIDEISKWLNARKSKLSYIMLETQFSHSVPRISFLYDLKASYDQEVQKLLDKVQEDLVIEEAPGCKNDKLDEKNTLDEEKVLSEKSLNFSDPIEEIDLDNYYHKALKCNDVYSYLRYVSPSGMDQNFNNLDYEHLLNKVLQNLPKTRQKMKLQSSPLTSPSDTSVGVHLPPININQQILVNTEMDYNTDERIKAIKKFVEINKKRRTKELNRLKLKILREESDRLGSYEDLKERLEEELKFHFGEEYEDEYEELKHNIGEYYEDGYGEEEKV